MWVRVGKRVRVRVGYYIWVRVEMLFFAFQENINLCWLNVCGNQNISKLSGFQPRFCLKTFEMFASQ